MNCVNDIATGDTVRWNVAFAVGTTEESEK